MQSISLHCEYDAPFFKDQLVIFWSLQFQLYRIPASVIDNFRVACDDGWPFCLSAEHGN